MRIHKEYHLGFQQTRVHPLSMGKVQGLSVEEIIPLWLSYWRWVYTADLHHLHYCRNAATHPKSLQGQCRAKCGLLTFDPARKDLRVFQEISILHMTSLCI